MGTANRPPIPTAIITGAAALLLAGAGIVYWVAAPGGRVAAGPEPVLPRTTPPPPHHYLPPARGGVRAVGRDGSVAATDGPLGKAINVYGPNDALRWTLAEPEPVQLVMTPLGDLVVHAKDGLVTDYDPQGVVRWRYDARPEEDLTIVGATADGIVFAHGKPWNDLDAVIRAIDANGHAAVILTTEADASHVQVTSDGGLLVQDGNLVVKHDAKGKELWRVTTGNDGGMVAETPDGIVVGSLNRVRGLDTQGNERWAVSLMGASTRDVITHVTVTPSGRVYAQTSELWAIENGRQLWHWDEAVLKEAPVVDIDGAVFARDERGTVYAIGPTGRLRWQWQPDAQPGAASQGGPMWLGGERSLVASVGRRLAVLDLGPRSPLVAATPAVVTTILPATASSN